MHRKKSLIWGAILAIFLGVTSVSYALTVGGHSQINTGIITVTGKSTTTCDIYADFLEVETALYRNEYNVNVARREGSSLRTITTSCGGSNLPGEQLWEVYGLHIAEHGNEQKIDTSYAVKYY